MIKTPQLVYFIAQNLVVPPALGFGLCKNTTGVVNETFIDFHTMLRAWLVHLEVQMLWHLQSKKAVMAI